MRKACLFAVAVVLQAASARAGDVAIIVHRSNPLSDISLVDLGRTFRLEQPRWKSGDKVEIVLQAGATAKQEVMLSHVFRMKADELPGYLLGKVNRNELSAPPRAFASDQSVKQFVAGNPRAVGYIDASQVDDTVRVLTVDGKHPGEAGYPLARELTTPTARPRGPGE